MSTTTSSLAPTTEQINSMAPQIISGIRRGKIDELEGLDQLVALIHARIRVRLCSDNIVSRDCQQDVCQNVIIDIIRGHHSYSLDKPFTVWLNAVVRNAQVDFLSKNSRERGEGPRRQNGLVRQLDEADCSALGTTPSELKTVAWDALYRLSERDRQVLYLRYFEQFTYAQIAEYFGVEHGMAGHYLRKAVEHLRRLFDVKPPSDDDPSTGSSGNSTGSHQARSSSSRGLRIEGLTLRFRPFTYQGNVLPEEAFLERRDPLIEEAFDDLRQLEDEYFAETAAMISRCRQALPEALPRAISNLPGVIENPMFAQSHVRIEFHLGEKVSGAHPARSTEAPVPPARARSGLSKWWATFISKVTGVAGGDESVREGPPDGPSLTSVRCGSQRLRISLDARRLFFVRVQIRRTPKMDKSVDVVKENRSGTDSDR